MEQVRKAIGAGKANFYLPGNSWGGILAMEYALKYQQNMKGLIVANMVTGVPEYGRYADEVLAKGVKPDVLKQIRAIEAKKDFSLHAAWNCCCLISITNICADWPNGPTR